MKTPLEVLVDRMFYARCCLKICEHAIETWTPGVPIQVSFNADVISAEDVSILARALSQYGWDSTASRQTDSTGKDCWAVIITPKDLIETPTLTPEPPAAVTPATHPL